MNTTIILGSMLFFCMRLEYKRKDKSKTYCRRNPSRCCSKTTCKNPKNSMCFHSTYCTFCQRSTKANDRNIYSSFCKRRYIIKNTNGFQKHSNQNKGHQNSCRGYVCCNNQNFPQHTYKSTYQKHP